MAKTRPDLKSIIASFFHFPSSPELTSSPPARFSAFRGCGRGSNVLIRHMSNVIQLFKVERFDEEDKENLMQHEKDLIDTIREAMDDVIAGEDERSLELIMKITTLVLDFHGRNES